MILVETNYYKPLDKFIKEVKMGFTDKRKETLTNLANVIFEIVVENESFEAVSKFSILDIDILKVDYKLFQHYKNKIERSDLTATEMLQKLTDNNLFQLKPGLSKVLEIFAILQVSLTLIHIEWKTVNILMKENMQQMIDRFGRNKRNSHFFFVKQYYFCVLFELFSSGSHQSHPVKKNCGHV